MEPVIKFEPSENAALAEATVSAIPTGGVVIVLDGEPSTSNSTANVTAPKGKKRRNQQEEVVIVKEKSGATKVSIPEFLFQEPSNKIKMMTLRKHLMISQIERNQSEKLFYDQCRGLIPHVKRMIASMPFDRRSAPAQNDETTDHGYAFPQNVESDCDD